MGWKTKVAVGVAALAGVGALAVAGAVAYAAFTADSLLSFPETPAPALAASTDPALIARGEYLVRGPAHCAQCHSTDDRAKPELVKTAPLQGGLAFEMGPIGARYGRNLTPDPVTGLGRYTDAEIARALRTGVTPDGNLSFFMSVSAARLADEDIVAVLSYLRSIPPVAHAVPPGEWYLPGKILLTYAFPEMKPLPADGPAWVDAADVPSIARGAYLADSVMLCTLCHTAMDPATFELVGEKGAGGLAEASHGADSDMMYRAPNLTRHPTGITGKWSEDAFVARLQAGRVHASSIMPWEGFQLTTESDLRSVYQYLRSLPPVDNDVGPTYFPAGS